MKKTTSILRLTLILLSIGFANATSAGLVEDGWAAMGGGNFEAAFKAFSKAAEQGDAEAQFGLGVMYTDGKGVPQDYKQAFSWYRKAAEQGFATAQFRLGAMYANGDGVPQDYVQAHKWFNLAAANGDKDATGNRNRVSNKMTPAQIAEAQKLAREWKPTVSESSK